MKRISTMGEWVWELVKQQRALQLAPRLEVTSVREEITAIWLGLPSTVSEAVMYEESLKRKPRGQ